MREEPSWTARRPLPHVDASDALTANKDTMRGAMRRSLRIAAVLCSARGLVAPARRAAPTRLMASASGAPEDETRGGTASLADQVARARTRVRKRFARASRETGACCGESHSCAERVILALRCGERSPRRRARKHYGPSCCVAARGRKRARAPTTRERPHTHAKKHTVRPSPKGGQPALPRHRERV